ncbi:MAG: thiosulfate oxidation carrier complex protein SoxZ, partial [Alphaproteobacteria bacterium]|nr:thiosulfate oxidation carrier complex protein SoxZ [Alphaproteobacteria bacterium]
MAAAWHEEQATSTPRVRVPASARAGEIVEIRTQIDHPMETGLRRDEGGRPVPRNMLRSF